MTPLQQAAQHLIDRQTPGWVNTEPTSRSIEVLRKALADEQAQAVEPVAWLVLDEDNVPIMCAPAKQMCNDHINDAINDYDIAEASRWVVRKVFTHPAPPASEQIDWQDMYLKAKSEKEAMAAKYEKDIGPLARVAPAATDERAKVGNSNFESWYGETKIQQMGTKQRYREAYEAGLNEAQQVAVPDARPPNCGTGHCSCIECPYPKTDWSAA